MPGVGLSLLKKGGGFCKHVFREWNTEVDQIVNDVRDGVFLPTPCEGWTIRPRAIRAFWDGGKDGKAVAFGAIVEEAQTRPLSLRNCDA